MLARPWPNSSRSGSWRALSDMPSATLAERRLSIAASAAMANAAENRSPIRCADIAGSDGKRKRARKRTDASHVEIREARPHPSPTMTAMSDAGKRCGAAGARPTMTTATSATKPARRPMTIPADRLADRPERDQHGVVARRLGDTERVRHLLQEDDHRDADREPFDHWPRHIAERRDRPEPNDAISDEHAGHEAGEEDTVGAVAGHERHEHDGHRAGRARHLHVRSAEHRRDESRDDRGDQPADAPSPVVIPNAERKRERDDPDRNAGDHIVLPRPAQTDVVRPPRQQPSERLASLLAQTSQQLARFGESEQENPLRDREQLDDERVLDGIEHRRSLAPRRHHARFPQDRELLRQMRQFNTDERLHLTDRSLALRQELQNTHTRRIRQRLEQLRLHDRERNARLGRLGYPSTLSFRHLTMLSGPGRPTAHHHDEIRELPHPQRGSPATNRIAPVGSAEQLLLGQHASAGLVCPKDERKKEHDAADHQHSDDTAWHGVLFHDGSSRGQPTAYDRGNERMQIAAAMARLPRGRVCGLSPSRALGPCRRRG